MSAIKKLHNIISTGAANLQKVTSTKINEIIDKINNSGLDYKVYTVLITQSSTSAPTVKVLKNTLSGAIVWTRTGAGQYLGTLNSAFTADKTFTMVNEKGQFGAFVDNTQEVELGRETANTVILGTSIDGIYSDGTLTDTPIEIRVYN